MEDNSNNTGTPITEQAKEQAQHVVQQSQQMAGQVWDMARGQFRSQLNGQKERAATGLQDIAQVVRQSGKQLQQQGQSGGSRYAEQIADRVGQFAATIHDKQIEEIIADTENFARRQPAAFLSVAAVLGFILVRFLKSSGQAAAAAA